MSGCPLSISVVAGLEDCNRKLLIAHDIIDALSGKWKMEVILSLLRFNRRRFKELQGDMPGVSSKMLSAVLKDLEAHHILMRHVIDDTAPVTVEYELTEYGKSMKDAITEFVKLGMAHRKEVIGK